jgi:predicted RNase H-like HicB family nuclease
MPHNIKILATWDPEASVFVITSDDVPGLVTEAASAEEIDKKLRIMIPELLELNSPEIDISDISVLIRTERHLSVTA